MIDALPVCLDLLSCCVPLRSRQCSMRSRPVIPYAARTHPDFDYCLQ